MKHGGMVFGVAMLLATGVALPTMYAAAAENVDIVEKLKTAKTASDHEAIASYYEAQAAEAKKSADVHRKMADTYTAGGTSIGKGSGPVPLPQHCHQLAKMLDEEASHYTSMAETHRALAKAAK